LQNSDGNSGFADTSNKFIVQFKIFENNETVKYRTTKLSSQYFTYSESTNGTGVALYNLVKIGRYTFDVYNDQSTSDVVFTSPIEVVENKNYLINLDTQTITEDANSPNSTPDPIYMADLDYTTLVYIILGSLVVVFIIVLMEKRK
jgi:hypothetical protein